MCWGRWVAWSWVLHGEGGQLAQVKASLTPQWPLCSAVALLPSRGGQPRPWGSCFSRDSQLPLPDPPVSGLCHPERVLSFYCWGRRPGEQEELTALATQLIFKRPWRVLSGMSQADFKLNFIFLKIKLVYI